MSYSYSTEAIFTDAFRRIGDQFLTPVNRELGRLIRAKMDTLMFPPLILDEKHIFPIAVELKPLGDNKVTTKQKVIPFNTIGVRFSDGSGAGGIAKIYSYKIRKGGKVHLGQELVADTPRGPAPVFVVRIDKTPNPEATVFLERKTVAL